MENEINGFVASDLPIWIAGIAIFISLGSLLMSYIALSHSKKSNDQKIKYEIALDLTKCVLLLQELSFSATETKFLINNFLAKQCQPISPRLQSELDKLNKWVDWSNEKRAKFNDAFWQQNSSHEVLLLLNQLNSVLHQTINDSKASRVNVERVISEASKMHDGDPET